MPSVTDRLWNNSCFLNAIFRCYLLRTDYEITRVFQTLYLDVICCYENYEIPRAFYTLSLDSSVTDGLRDKLCFLKTVFIYHLLRTDQEKTRVSLRAVFKWHLSWSDPEVTRLFKTLYLDIICYWENYEITRVFYTLSLDVICYERITR